MLACLLVAAAAGSVLIADARAQRRVAVPMHATDEFAAADGVLRWINDYRLMPTPEKLPRAMHALSRQGVFRDLESSGVYIGFAAGVLGDNATIADKLVTGMFPMPPEEQTVIVKAIAFSGLPDWQGLMARFSERMPARRVMIDSFVRGKLKLMADMPLDSGPAAVDILWGHYFATGRPDVLKRIVEALAWSTDKKDVTRLTIGGMAKFTLASNAARDKTVLDFCRDQLPKASKEVAAPLKEVIEAAESFEIAKIRTQALASIDELKRKGPPSPTGGWAWWAQASSIAIAFGCVAASVSGHVELGIPCIVSGALAQGASRWLSMPQ
jgi:hypothetical protein